MKQLLSFLSLFCLLSAHGQDYHHWSEQYGTRATLLGGAATSGLEDNGTVFYNAAGMAWVDDPNLSVTVNAYKVGAIWIDNAVGQGQNLRQWSLLTYPNLIAGIVEHDKFPRIKVGYAVLTKKTFNSSFDYLHQAQYEIIDSAAGPENFVAAYNYNHNVLEYWSGFGISYRLSKRWSIGFSHFGIYKQVGYSNNISMTALPTDPTSTQIAEVNSKIDFSYWDVKGNFKPAINFNSSKFKFGLTYTTPTFHVIGRGDVYRELSYSQGIGLPPAPSDVVIVGRADNLKVTTKEYGSLAIGVSFKFGSKAWLHFSHETFVGVPYYRYFDADNSNVTQYPITIPDSTLDQAFGNQNFLAYGEQTKAVTNFGVGYEVRITNRLDMLAGIRLDQLYLDTISRYYTFEKIQVESSKWNLLHGSVGFGYWTKTNKKWTLGFDYSFLLPFPFKQFINFTDPTPQNYLSSKPAGANEPGAARARQFSLKLVLGIEFGTLTPFKTRKDEEEEKKNKDKLE